MRQKLRGLLADRDEGIAYDSGNLTVGAYLERWLDSVKGTVRGRTWDRHEQVVRLHLEPTIGHHRLERLNAVQVQALRRRGQRIIMSRNRRTRDKREQERADADRRAWDRFRPRLESLSSFIEARLLVKQAPPPDSPGRRYYSNLGFFLQDFTVPSGSSY